MVKQLLAAGASPDIAAPGGIRPLHLACAGAITTSSTRSKICLAHFYDQQQLWKKAGPGSSPIVKLLLAAGADQTSRTASGATGLHIAANSGSADVVADLLESSEDVDPDDDGAYNCKYGLEDAAAAGRHLLAAAMIVTVFKVQVSLFGMVIAFNLLVPYVEVCRLGSGHIQHQSRTGRKALTQLTETPGCSILPSYSMFVVALH